MIEVKPFTIDVVSKYESFYLLQNILNVQEIEVFHNTPSGQVEFPKINAFLMPNDKIIIAWPNSINMAQFYNLVVVANGIIEVISMSSIERIIDIYNKQSDSNFGLFSFANSNIVLQPNIDWRCDAGKYGPGIFPPSTTQIVNPENLVLFEPIISITGIAHLLYIEYQGDPSAADDFLNNSEKPAIGRTFWECLKLVREWSIVNSEPFNNNELIAEKANQFINGLNFSNEELQIIDAQVPMQIAKYIFGDDNARQRPDDIFEMNDDVRNILFKRLSSGTMSAIELLNPGLWNLDELISADKQNISNRRNVLEIGAGEIGLPQNFINLQNRLLNNRELIISKIENGEF